MESLIEGIEPGEQNQDPAAATTATTESAAADGAEQNQEAKQEDWRAGLPEDLRGNESLGKFKSAGDLAKSYISMEKLIGKKTIGLPDENSSEKDWGKLWNRLGRPESPEKYEVKRAEGLPDELKNEKGTAEFLQAAHKAGLSQKQITAVIAEYDRQLLEEMKNIQAQEAVRKDAVVGKLRDLWGQDLQLKVERAEQTLGVLDPDNRIDRAGLRNNAEVIQLLNLVSERVMGDQLPVKGDSGGISDIEDRIAVLRVSPAFSNEMHADHDRVMTEYKMLMQKRTALRSRG